MNLKDICKNPFFYYIAVPVLTALWPLLLRGHYLPAASQGFEKEKTQYEKAQDVINQILTLDPDRLAYAKAATEGKEFDYATAVQQTANRLDIPSAKYKLTSAMLITSKGQKTQSARVAIEDIEIQKFAEFLSDIHTQWPNLQSDRLKLTKKKESPNSWKIDIDFKYFF